MTTILKWPFLNQPSMETSFLSKMYPTSSEPFKWIVRLLRTKLRGTNKHPLDAREIKLLLLFVPESLDQSLGIRHANKSFKKCVNRKRITQSRIRLIIIGVIGINSII